MGGMTDCFQPIELRERVTLDTIKLLNHYGVGYLIVTKSPVVSYPFYLDVLDRDLAHIQITVTCLDPVLSRKYEKAHLPTERVKALLELQERGYDVAIRLSPLLEEYMDFDLLNKLGINKCVVEFLRYNSWIKEWFARADFKKYTLYHANYHHLPLEEKIRIIGKVKIPSVTVCEKVPEHYEYWQKNFNPNPADCCNLRLSPQPEIIKVV
jgi:DNA repair photolyase